MPLLAEHTDIWILKCQCGWRFMAFNLYETKCPQCRDIVARCRCCNEDISDKQAHSIYCDTCSRLTKLIYDRVAVQESRKRDKFKDREIRLCDYDCFNCKFGDCIQSVDSDDLTLPLFETD